MAIEELRKSKGLTQAQAAVLLKMPLRTYQNYESPRISPTSWRALFIEKELRAYEPYNEKQGILLCHRSKPLPLQSLKPTASNLPIFLVLMPKGLPTVLPMLTFSSKAPMMVSPSLN